MIYFCTVGTSKDYSVITFSLSARNEYELIILNVMTGLTVCSITLVS